MKNIKYSLLVLILTLSLSSCSNRSNFISEFVNYPNPFKASSEYTTFYVNTNPSAGSITKANVIVYSSNGDVLANIDMQVYQTSSYEASANWHGVDKNGNVLPSSLYYADISVENSQGNISKASTKTLINN